jgi:hypothetical protein
MPLVQFVITLDDIYNNANETSNGFTTIPVTAAAPSYNSPATVNRPCNLYGGRYRARVDGFHIETGAYNTTTYGQNPQIVYISSSLFHFPAMGQSALAFTTNSYNVMADMTGHREFEINAINGNVDLSISISQFGQAINANPAAVSAPFTIDRSATWQSAQFAYLILSLHLEPCDSKATFGQVKGAFQ